MDVQRMRGLRACVRTPDKRVGMISPERVYSIASTELGHVVGGLLNDVRDVTSLKGKLGQANREKGTALRISSDCRSSPRSSFR